MVVVPRRTRGALLHDGAMHAPDQRAAAFTQGRCASAQLAAMLAVQPLRGLRGRVVAQLGAPPVDVVPVLNVGARVGGRAGVVVTRGGVPPHVDGERLASEESGGPRT